MEGENDGYRRRLTRESGNLSNFAKKSIRIDAPACLERIRALTETAEMQRGGNCNRRGRSRPTSSQSVCARRIIWRRALISLASAASSRRSKPILTAAPRASNAGWPGRVLRFAVVPLLIPTYNEYNIHVEFMGIVTGSISCET